MRVAWRSGSFLRVAVRCAARRSLSSETAVSARPTRAGEQMMRDARANLAVALSELVTSSEVEVDLCGEGVHRPAVLLLDEVDGRRRQSNGLRMYERGKKGTCQPERQAG